jgi:hypothetical protein
MMRLILLTLLAAAATAAEPIRAPLSAAQQKKLDTLLTQLRTARDPVLKLTPISGIVDLGPGAVEAALADLLPLLESPNGGVRHDALYALRPPVRLANDALLKIERLLADPEPQVRELAHSTLDQIRLSREREAAQARLSAAKGQTPEQLLAALKSPEVAKRDDAARILRQRAQEDAEFRLALSLQTEALLELARHRDSGVRATAMVLAARCLDPLPDAAIAAAATATTDTDEEVGEAAVFALSRAPAASASALAALRAAAESDNARIKGAALAALADLGISEPGLGDLASRALAAHSAKSWKGACAYLVSFRQRVPDAAPRLEAIITDPNPTTPDDIRGGAIKALAVTAEAETTLPMLSRLANEGPSTQRIASCEALVLMGERAAPAAPMLERLAGETKDQRVREAAKASLRVIAPR